jgi:hypothetical protein
MNQFNQLDAQDEMASLAIVSTLEIFSSEENEVEKKTCVESKMD